MKTKVPPYDLIDYTEEFRSNDLLFIEEIRKSTEEKYGHEASLMWEAIYNHFRAAIDNYNKPFNRIEIYNWHGHVTEEKFLDDRAGLLLKINGEFQTAVLTLLS